MTRARNLATIGLTLEAGIIVIAGMALLSLVSGGGWTLEQLAPGIIFATLLLVAQVTTIVTGYGLGGMLFPLVGLLSGLGLVLAYRLGGQDLGNRQLLWIVLGITLALGVCLLLKDVTHLRRHKYTWAVLGVLLVTLTFVLGQDPNGSGARLWLGFGSQLFQPSEFLKIMLVIFFAGYLEENREIMARGRVSWGFIKLPPLAHVLPLAIMWVLSMMVLLVQRDFGTALLFFGVFLSMLYVATARVSYILAGSTAFLAGAIASYRWIEVVQIRMDAWLDPWSRASGYGYQTIQGLISMASGGVLGSGLGLGRPDFVPASFTDLVLAALGEEFGLLGTMGILFVYLLLIHRGYHIALTASRPFDRLLATGLTTVLALQSLIIMGGTLRLLPLTGIALPFLAYGGSSLVTNFTIVGLLLKVAGRRPVHA
ncbi:MAG: FtsW/RodA/SpoVE family cell cycle protein [Dehalococcoidia bacterium]|nr:FtsW/RodA/SpoVE family cell cycle protein [Dehalococcoidia bacterium]